MAEILADIIASIERGSGVLDRKLTSFIITIWGSDPAKLARIIYILFAAFLICFILWTSYPKRHTSKTTHPEFDKMMAPKVEKKVDNSLLLIGLVLFVLIILVVCYCLGNFPAGVSL